MPKSTTSSGESKKGSVGSKKRFTSFDAILKQLKTNSLGVPYKINKNGVGSNIKHKFKTLNKKIQDTVAYGKEIIEKALKVFNGKFAINKSLLQGKESTGTHDSKATKKLVDKFGTTQQDQGYVDSENSSAKYNMITSNYDGGDDDIAQQAPEIQVKSSHLDGHVKKKTLNLINSLKNISIATEKKDTPPQNQKLVGIVS